jgi:surfeit locus 1 family protein
VTRRIPIVATIVVAAAALAMVALGVWQLQRKQWKEGLIARYQAAVAMSSDIPWPATPAGNDKALFRHSRFDCAEVTEMSASSGRSATGEPGWAHVAHCRLANGSVAKVALGWSRDPAAPSWNGGEVAGFVAPAGDGIRLVAAPPRAGLAQLATPDPNDLPNNHFAYAIQWFIFALISVVIYVLAVRKRSRASGG